MHFPFSKVEWTEGAAEVQNFQKSSNTVKTWTEMSSEFLFIISFMFITYVSKDDKLPISTAICLHMWYVWLHAIQ